MTTDTVVSTAGLSASLASLRKLSDALNADTTNLSASSSVLTSSSDMSSLATAAAPSGLNESVLLDALHMLSGALSADTTLSSAPSAALAASASSSPQPGPARFSVTAAGQPGTLAGDPYMGPITYLKWEYIAQGNAPMALVANVADVYVVAGAGDDAITAGAGHNVIDGGAGSNFLTSGTGTDTFFADARGGNPVWDTLVNFHPGDALTLWGFAPGQDQLTWAADQGAKGFTGLTLHASVGGHDLSATFAGMAMADLSKLVISGGSSGGVPYLYVTM